MAKRSKKRKAVGGGISTREAGKVAGIPLRPVWLSRDWLFGLILILAVVLAYQPVWWEGFVWDDEVLVTANPCIIGPLGLKEIWTTSAADICPFTLTTFWMEHALWGLAPLPYHLVNVLMHGAGAVVLWRVLRRLRVPGAWLGAAVWALHPVQVESVAYIAEMKNTESGLFFLLSILFFVRWVQGRGLDRQTDRGLDYGLTLLFAALAMASKSSTVILPLVLCMCAWWAEGRWNWRNLARVVPILLMSAVTSVVSVWTQGLELTTAASHTQVRSWPERLATAGDAVWFYLGKLVWPHPLIAIYPRWEIDAGRWISYLPLLAAIIVLLFLWLKRESWSRPWFFAYACFLAALLPVLGLANMTYSEQSFVADHFQYLAGMSPLALASAGMVRGADFALAGRYWLKSILGAGVLLVLGLMSWQRACVYESAETLWTDTLAQNPDCRAARINLGNILLKRGEPDEAIVQYRKAMEIEPNYGDAYNNLGNALVKKGRLDEAITQFHKAVEIQPNYADAYNNLALALIQQGHLDEAIDQEHKALEIDPDYVEGYYNLGNALIHKGRVDEAIEQYRKALEINPDDADAHNNLGYVFFQEGRMDQAITEYQRALKINSTYAAAYYNLGNALVHAGQVDEAIANYLEALKFNPDGAEVHINYGNALLQKGEIDEAMIQYQATLKIDPNFADGHNDLGVVLFRKGQADAAIAEFQEALRLNPNYANARDNLVKARALTAQAVRPK